MTTSEHNESQGSTMRRELRNMMNFHVLDFIGVNNKNWDLFGHSHADDVIVDFGGQRKNKAHAHLDEMRKLLDVYPNMLVIRHDPNVAQGDWTATVANITGWGPREVRFVTVAKWRDNKVVEEYLFTRELTSEEAIAIETTQPTITITTPDDPELWLAGGIELGWTCNVYGSGPGNKTAVFTRRQNGNTVQRIALSEV